MKCVFITASRRAATVATAADVACNCFNAPLLHSSGTFLFPDLVERVNCLYIWMENTSLSMSTFNSVNTVRLLLAIKSSGAESGRAADALAEHRGD